VVETPTLRHNYLSTTRALLVLVGTLCFTPLVGCRTPMTNNKPSPSRRDINAVLADHDDQLLAIPGVVGVYVAVLDDQKTSCLKVMLARKDETLERSIPRRIEGYPVVTEVTGEIRPMNNRRP
jgi:hypothetical protein